MEHVELDVPELNLADFPWDSFESRFGKTAFV
jgi:hypothetical protein